jgi:hypothetical protein
MPGGNRKGPRNEGPQTGRGLGYCANSDEPGEANIQPGQGFGRGFRRGRRGRFNVDFRPGRGRGWFSTSTESQNEEPRQTQIQELQDALQAIKNRLDELEA